MFKNLKENKADDLAPPSKEYILSKKLKSNYSLRPNSPSTTEQYDVDIDDHQGWEEPYLNLRVNGVVVASSRRYEDESHTFVIKTTPTDEDPSKPAIAHLQRWGQQRGALELALQDDPTRHLSWKNRGVNGERFELVDTTTKLDTVVARFEVGGLMSRGGKMRMLVDWGLDFERIALTSLVTLFEKQSFWGKTYDPRGGKTPIPIPRHGGETNLAACVT